MNAPTVRPHPLGGIVVELPGLRLTSEANTRGHSFAKVDRVASQRRAIGSTLRVMAGAPPRLPCRVVITRVAPLALDDDNLGSACKAARDAIAVWLCPVVQTLRTGPRAGTTRTVGDDRDPRVEWVVAQEKGPYGVRVEVVPVRPFGGAGTARVTHEGAVTVVEAVLSPNNFDALAAQVAAIGRGAQRSVTIRMGATRITVRVPEKE